MNAHYQTYKIIIIVQIKLYFENEERERVKKSVCERAHAHPFRIYQETLENYDCEESPIMNVQLISS